jgi:hypothetical protein
MKTIFRYINSAALVAAIAAFGAVAGFAQNPCEDAAGMTALDAKFRENYNKDRAARKIAIEAGKQYIEKYSSCGETTAEFITYLKNSLPKMEERIRDEEARAGQQALYTRFDAAVKANNFDEVYSVGREILAKEPEQLDVLISLGSIGYDQSFEKNNYKYNDDTLRYARQAIAALEAGKPAKTYGLFNWTFKDKNTALSELNLTVGYITQVAQKNKKDSVEYLYKATQGGSSTAKNPIPYELIGWYYFDELNKLVQQIKTAEATQSASDTAEVAQKKVDDIKALVAMANGTAERAMDAFSRAYSLAAPSNAPYRAKLKKNVEDAYKLRHGKVEGVDAYIASVSSKPFPNPTSPITPISDPDTVKTGGASSVSSMPEAPSGNTTGAIAKPAAATAAPAKPAPAKAAAAKGKKTVAKKGV